MKKLCALVFRDSGKLVVSFLGVWVRFLLRLKLPTFFCIRYRFCRCWCPWRTTWVCISFVSWPSHNIPWVIHFLRGININVQLLLAQSYQSYVFSRVFFLSLIVYFSSDITIILSLISSEHTSFKKPFL